MLKIETLKAALAAGWIKLEKIKSDPVNLGRAPEVVLIEQYNRALADEIRNKKRRIIKLHTDGKVEELPSAKMMKLAEMQKHVGGYIEVHTVRYDGVEARMVVNEEGRLKKLPLNQAATNVFFLSQGGSPIVGDALIFIGFRKNQI